MRVSLRQIVEKSREVAHVSLWLRENLNKMVEWEHSFVDLVFNGKQKNWPKQIAKEYDRANLILRSSRRLIREALKAMIPNLSHERADAAANEIITIGNIKRRFDNVVVVIKTN